MAEDKRPLKGIDLNKFMDSIFKRHKQEGESGNSLFSVTSAAKTKLLKPGGLKKSLSSLPLFNIMKKQNFYFTGLDVGTSAVKSVVFSCKDASRKLINVDSEEISYENFQSASRREVIAECLRKLQRRGAMRGKVNLSLGLPNLLVEFMTMPVIPQAELDKAIRWEAREKFLVDEEASVIDYLSLGEANTGQQAQNEILFFSTPKKDIIENYRVLAGLGIRPFAIRPNFLASFQAFENKSLWKNDEVVGLLDIGAGSTSFSIVASGYVHFYRKFNVSGDSITRSIADYCRVSYEDAEKSKRELGMSPMALEEDRKDQSVAGDSRVRISHAMGLHMDHFIAEIEYTFNYYALNISAEPVEKMDRIVLTGGGACTKGICDFLRKRLNVPVDAPNPFSYIQAKLEGVNAAQLSDRGPRYATAIGLVQGSGT